MNTADQGCGPRIACIAGESCISAGVRGLPRILKVAGLCFHIGTA